LRLKTFITALAVTAALVSARANIIVSNANFETVTGTTAADWHVGNGPVSDILGNGVGGSYGETFGAGVSQIHEKVNLGGTGIGPTVTYQISFSAMNLDTNPQTFVQDGEFEVRLAGSSYVAAPVAVGTTIGAYQQYVVDITTTKEGLRGLAFKWTGDSKGGEGLLDDVSVSVVPEPSTLLAGAAMLVPFGVGLFRSLRRRRGSRS
jgi:hypothetical protein